MFVMAIDAGTTGVRAIVFDQKGRPVASEYSEFPQHFPRPGWVEHDLDEIWTVAQGVVTKAVASAADSGAGDSGISAIGITNQRETACAWSKSSGRPLHRAIVWQDRRTSDRCRQLESDGLLDEIRSRTGLLLDPYFTATKFEWLLRQGGIAADSDLALGTIDSWILYKLTGGRVHATDPSNASRTLLFDLDSRAWSPELAEIFDIPIEALPMIQPSSGEFGISDPEMAGGLSVPVSGIAGDQQAALFGQACFEPGMTKNTYGTGSFVLMNVGSSRPPTVEGLLTTVAWQLAELTYAYEGSIFSTGSAVQWLRDGLGIIDDASDTEGLASSVDDTGDVFFVPAFTGLGSPWWDPYARGTLIGITRGTGRSEIARAVVEAMALQTRDVIDAMVSASGRAIKELRVDGGASVMNLLCQMQADQLGVTVRRPVVEETTALGAAYLAGLATGVWSSTGEIEANWEEEASFAPVSDRSEADRLHARWLEAVTRSRGWAPTIS